MKRKFTTEQFIAKSKNIHGAKYVYNNTVYTGMSSPVIITCNSHGDFEVLAKNHIHRKSGCPKCKGVSCSKRQLMTTEEFIIAARKVHGDKFDYSETVYRGYDTPVTIISPEHGEFTQPAGNHLRGCIPRISTSPRTSKRKPKRTTEEFIERAKEVHGDKYNYSTVCYKNSTTKVRILCPIHGEFMQRPGDHLRGCGCPQCRAVKMSKINRLTTESFIRRGSKKHNNKYDYSKVVYTKRLNSVTIICPEHGEFEQLACNHLIGHGCPVCGNINRAEKNRKTTEEFIEEARAIHLDKYDYLRVVYTGNTDKVEIICKEHGTFLQTPADHLTGSGCPKCTQSLGEATVERILTEYSIEFEKQKSFPGCVNTNSLRFDFYLPEYNTAIEYDGIQHFKPIDRFGGSTQLAYIQHNDQIKTQYCIDNNITLVRIKYTEDIHEKLSTALSIV